MPEYAQMSDDELTLEVARRQGWTDLETVDGWFEDPLIGPHIHHWLQGTSPAGEKEAVCPCWSTDLNAAWRLLDGINAQITVMNGPDGEMLIRWWDRVWFGSLLPNPSRAICVAWLECLDYHAAHPDLFTEEYEALMRISRENERKAMQKVAMLIMADVDAREDGEK